MFVDTPVALQLLCTVHHLTYMVSLEFLLVNAVLCTLAQASAQ